MLVYSTQVSLNVRDLKSSWLDHRNTQKVRPPNRKTTKCQRLSSQHEPQEKHLLLDTARYFFDSDINKSCHNVILIGHETRRVTSLAHLYRPLYDSYYIHFQPIFIADIIMLCNIYTLVFLQNKSLLCLITMTTEHNDIVPSSATVFELSCQLSVIVTQKSVPLSEKHRHQVLWWTCQVYQWDRS